MIEYLLIIYGALVLIIIAFFAGVWYGLDASLDIYEYENETEDLYCFDCEIEMPFTVKNGKMYCSNCCLPH